MSLFTVHVSLFSVHVSLFSLHVSLFPIHESLFSVPVSLFSVRVSFILVHMSLFSTSFDDEIFSPLISDEKKSPADSLFLMTHHGELIEYVLEPMGTADDKLSDDAPLQLTVTPKGQWTLLR